MAGSKTDAHENNVLNTMRGTGITAWTPYLALFTVAPSENDNGTELALGGYSRQAVTFGAPTTSGNGKQVANSVEVIFPSMTGSGEQVVGLGYYDSGVGGELRYYDDAIDPITINGVTIISMGVGDLIIREF